MKFAVLGLSLVWPRFLFGRHVVGWCGALADGSSPESARCVDVSTGGHRADREEVCCGRWRRRLMSYGFSRRELDSTRSPFSEQAAASGDAARAL